MKIEDAGEMLYQAHRYYRKVEKEVKGLLDTLTPRENAWTRHFNGLGLEQIGYGVIARRFKITVERSKQIGDRAIRKIAHKSRVEQVNALLMAIVRASNPDPFETEEGRQHAVNAVLVYREEMKQWPKELEKDK